MPPLPRLQVVAGILLDSANNVLIAERLGDPTFAGLWEFPGGKRRADESASGALGRELNEELGVTPTESQPFLEIDHDYSDRRVKLEFFVVTSWLGEPKGLLGQRLRWCACATLGEENLLPADQAVVRKLVDRYG